jgi:LemA protein
MVRGENAAWGTRAHENDGRALPQIRNHRAAALRLPNAASWLKLRADRSWGKPMSTGSYVLIGVVVVIVVFAIGIYNSLVSGRAQVRNSWSQIDIQLKRRHDLIPNLVNSVKGAMDFEKGTLTAVVEARSRAVAAKSPQESMQAENALTGALGRFMAVAEAYPQLRSQEGVSSLMEELKSTENMIAFARQHYNDAVQSQNIRIASFPNVLLAGPFGFQAETLFQVPEAEHAAIAAAPEVKLS